MAAYLGIDIGTRESKGVLIDDKGKIIAMEVVGHGVTILGPDGFLRMRKLSGGEIFAVCAGC